MADKRKKVAKIKPIEEQTIGSEAWPSKAALTAGGPVVYQPGAVILRLIAMSDSIPNTEKEVKRLAANPFGDRLILASAAAEGAPGVLVTALEESPFYTKGDLAHAMGVSTKSVERYARAARLAPTQTERLLQLDEVVYEGVKTFESEAKFYRWFIAPSAALGGAIPKSLLTTSYGVELVLGELNAIEYGIFA